MKHRSEQGKREAEVRALLQVANRRYLVATTVAEKQTIHSEIIALETEREALAQAIHQYTCINPKCGNRYSAASAHGFGFLSSWTSCDETGRPIPEKTKPFPPEHRPKIGYCPECMVAIEADIDSL